MDDFAWVHYTVRYKAVYIQPVIDQTICKGNFSRCKLYIDGIISDISSSHVTLLAFNLLTILLLKENINEKKYEIVDNLADLMNSEADEDITESPANK